MKLFQKVQKWISANKVESLVILIILLIALGLRLYRIDQYMTFLGDEGRDMIVMQKIWVEYDLPFIGPPTSVGNMYLGPLYYYMMAVVTGVFWLNPVAAAAMNAFIGVGTVGFIYYLSRLWFGRVAAFVAAILYTLSPVTIVYSRSSWNPNPAPIFALLAIFGLFKVHQTGNMWWLILSGAAFAFLVNMHYLALVLLPILGLLWLYEIVVHYRGKIKRTRILSGTILSIVTFLFLMTPLFLFEVKHHYPNYYALITIFSSKDSSVGGGVGENLMKFWPILSEKLIARYLGIADTGWLFILMVTLLILSPLVWVSVNKLRGRRLKWPFLGLGVWLLVGLVGLTLYKQEIYDHYLGFINPVPFLLFGALGMLIWNLKHKTTRFGLMGLYGLIMIVIVFQMLLISPLKKEPNKQLQRTQDIAREVLNDTKGKPYNFALIAKSNYDSAYQFYLEQFGQKPGQLPFEKTEQLFIVCEDEICEPINNPKYEIAAFGMAKVEWMREFQGVKLYKLIANPEGKPS